METEMLCAKCEHPWEDHDPILGCLWTVKKVRLHSSVWGDVVQEILCDCARKLEARKLEDP